MSASIVFNDASLPFLSTGECEQYLPVFFEILKKALKNQVNMIRVDENIGSNWYQIYYSAGFSFPQWINNQADLDYRRSLRMIMDKTCCPLISPEEREQLDAYEASHFELIVDDTAVSAIGSAFLLDIAVVSFLSKPHWYGKLIFIKHEYIDAENECIKQKNCEVENISQRDNLALYLEKLQSERQASSAYLKTLIQSGNADYKNLIFCTNVLDAFKQPSFTKKLLNKIKEVLKGLNGIIETASSDGEIIANLALNITGESDKTKNNSNLIKYRKFKLPDGLFFIFDFHVKNFPDGKRLYFHADFQLKKIYIGYFGSHLPV